MTATDASLALPHGGMEIGGVLFGTRTEASVCILAERPLACEHALGPTFTLSAEDGARLRKLLDEGRAQGLEPVGWYHSHTRSEVFLSAQDVEIHNRYFPESWQVALVVRPHILQPVRAGFFFREPDGSIHSDSSYREFVLEPLKKAPTPKSTQDTPPYTTPVRDSIEQTALAPRGRRPFRKWLRWAAIAFGLAAFSAVLFPLRTDWSRALAAVRSNPVSLAAYDLDGQLQIHWNQAAEAVRAAESGTLEIVDAGGKTAMVLDKQQLRSGTVSYTRYGARVDVRLVLCQPAGERLEEFTTFLGHYPVPGQPAASEDATVKLRQELEDQAARTRKLQQDIAGLRWLLRQEQERSNKDAPQ